MADDSSDSDVRRDGDTITVDELVALLEGLGEVTVQVASEADGAPEVAWGDVFAYAGAERTWPFATVVVSDYPGFDESSRLDRPGVHRLNVHVGRGRFADLLGFPPAAAAEHASAYDPAALDVLIPHPQYAAQAWVSILNPGRGRRDEVLDLLRGAYERTTR